jgi:hypothetical protein
MSPSLIGLSRRLYADRVVRMYPKGAKVCLRLTPLQCIEQVV